MISNEYYTHIYDNCLSDSFIQLKETRFSSFESGNYYSQLNVPEPLVDTSPETYSVKAYLGSCENNIVTRDSSQDSTDTAAIVTEHMSKLLNGDLEYQFLLELVTIFPYFSLFCKHPFFRLFSDIWMEFRSNLLFENNIAYRYQILPWLSDTISSISRVLVNIINLKCENENPDAQSESMVSAFLEMREQMTEAYQRIQITKENRVLSTEDPTTAKWPLLECTEKLNPDITYHLTYDPNMVDTSTVGINNVLDHPFQVCQQTSYDNSRNDFQCVFGLVYSSDEVEYCNIQNSNLLLATNSVEYPVTVLDSSPTESCVSTPKALYIPHVIPNINNETLASEIIPTYQVIEEYTQKFFPIHNPEPMPLPHVHPSWVHLSTSSSVPITPAEEIKKINFMSLPTSPTWKNEAVFSQEPAQEDFGSTSCTTFPVSTNESVVYSQGGPDMSLLLSQFNSPVSNYYSDDFFRDKEDMSIRSSTMEESDYEYDHEEIFEEEHFEERRRSKRARITRSRKHTETASTSSVISTANTEQNISSRAISKNLTTNRVRSYTRRTATSYDSQTTHYLKSVFFDIYSHRDKLTKNQRRQVQRVTGLKPRNITYWFSNHKRRFRYALIKFKEAKEESNGKIRTYEDFVNWRHSQGLPEEVLPNECTSRSSK